MSETAKPIVADRERLRNRRAHTLLIFLNAEKGGTAISDAARDSAVVASLALQHGVDPDTLRHALMRNGSGEPSGPLGVLLDSLSYDADEAENQLDNCSGEHDG